MIFIDRSTVANPFRKPNLAQRAAQELESARARVAAAEFQHRFEFTAYRRPEVKAALNELFKNKCAYCETQLTSGPGDIEQYRPKAGVSEAPEHLGYWWLANDWSNLLIACVDCNRLSKSEVSEIGRSESIGKHNRFPLGDESKRAYTPEDDLSLEQPLLLDPTVDAPELHLTFLDNGLVVSETERGNVTISVLGLNRARLVEGRKRVAALYRTLFTLGSDLGARGAPKYEIGRLAQELREMAERHAPHAGMVRQMFGRDQSQLREIERLGAADLELVPPGGRPSAEMSVPVSKARLRRAIQTSKAYRERMGKYSLADEAGIQRYKSERRAIERIWIRNIRAIVDFDVDLTRQGAGTGRWLMLLGENGTGKSTVLQAVALVLGGSDYVSRLLSDERVSLPELVRARCRAGEVFVKLSGFTSPHRLKVFRDHLEFTSPANETVKIGVGGEVTGAAWKPQTVMAGYGATRLSERRGHKAAAGGEFARVENLFDPFVPLIDAESWLTGLGPLEFDRAAIIIKDLLGVPDALMVRAGGYVTVRMAGTTVRLASLSVGYQTVLTATADMLQIVSRVWQNPLDAEGIVLIDELDAHLHPTWQMQIVGSLRKALPGVQFITTTHQPLCLRGLAEGEVVVMRRGENGRIEVLTNLPSPADFRVDQLLTSSFFGLNSTTDPDTERLFDSYYALLAMKERSDEQDAELTRLMAALEGRRQFGDTQREGLYLEAIDRVLAKHQAMPELPQEEIREEAVSEISAIWERLTADAASAERLRDPR